MYEHENCNPHIKNLGCILQKNLLLSELMNAALSPTKKLVILMVWKYNNYYGNWNIVNKWFRVNIYLSWLFYEAVNMYDFVVSTLKFVKCSPDIWDDCNELPIDKY